MDYTLRQLALNDQLADLKADGYHIFWTENFYEVDWNSVCVAHGGTAYEWTPGDEPFVVTDHANAHLQCAIWQAERHQRNRHAMAVGDQSVGLYAIDADDFRESLPEDPKVRRLRTPLSLGRWLRERVGELLAA